MQRSVSPCKPTLLAVADRSFGSIAADFEQFMPRGWSFAARGIVVEGWIRQIRPRFFDGCNDAPFRLYFISARKYLAYQADDDYRSAEEL
jgi:hypothetical protein